MYQRRLYYISLRKTLIILLFLTSLNLLFANEQAKKIITSHDHLISIELTQDFYNIFTPRIQRQIPGANFAQYSKRDGELKLLFGQVIYLSDHLKGNDLSKFVHKYEAEMKKTQPSFSITIEGNQFTFTLAIIRGLKQTCRGTLFDEGTKVIQVCGRTNRKSHNWIEEALSTIQFHL